MVWVEGHAVKHQAVLVEKQFDLVHLHKLVLPLGIADDALFLSDEV